MDISHWPQVIGVVKAPMEGSKQPINNNSNERRGTTTSIRPHQKDQAVNCPRCNSTNTKFCYYNNYSLTQPRYFCKTCRRYWTEGGSLRNVPVGGGSRKNKRPSSSSSSMSNSPSSSSSNKKPNIHDHDHHHHNPLLLPPSLNFPLLHQNPSNKSMIHQGQDLNLAYPPTSSDHHHNMPTPRMSFVNPSTTTTVTTTTTTNNASPTSSSQHVSAMELLKNSSGLASSNNNNNTRGLMMSSFMPMPVVPEFSSFANLGHHEFKPSLISFGLDHPHHHQYHHQGGYSNGNSTNNVNGHGHGVVQDSTSSARLLFPSTTEDLKEQVSNDHHQDHDRSTHHQFEEINRGQGDSSTNNVYNWNGMLGGGSW